MLGNDGRQSESVAQLALTSLARPVLWYFNSDRGLGKAGQAASPPTLSTQGFTVDLS